MNKRNKNDGKNNVSDIKQDTPTLSDTVDDTPLNLDNGRIGLNVTDDDQTEQSDKKQKFHWFFWIVVVVLVCGVVVGFYYPSFYDNAGEYARYMTNKIMGKEPMPLRMVGEHTDNIAKVDMQNNADKNSNFVNDTDTKEFDQNTEEAESELETEMPTESTEAKIQAEEESEKLNTEQKQEQDQTAKIKELANLKEHLLLAQEQLETQKGMLSLVKRAWNLRKAVISSKDFTSELKDFTKVKNVNMAVDKDLAVLAIFAKGIKSEHDLQDEFGLLLKKAMALPDLNDNMSFWDKTLASLKTMIVVRKTDGSESGVLGTLTLAEKAVKSGNMPKAVELVKNLPSMQRIIFTEWCEDVMARWQVIEASANILDEVANVIKLSDLEVTSGPDVNANQNEVDSSEYEDIKEGE